MRSSPRPIQRHGDIKTAATSRVSSWETPSASPSVSSTAEGVVGRDSGVALGGGGVAVSPAEGDGAPVGVSGPAVALAMGEALGASVGGTVAEAGAGEELAGEGLIWGSGVAVGPAAVGCGEVGAAVEVGTGGSSVGSGGLGVRVGSSGGGVTGWPVGVLVGIVWPA